MDTARGDLLCATGSGIENCGSCVPAYADADAGQRLGLPKRGANNSCDGCTRRSINRCGSDSTGMRPCKAAWKRWNATWRRGGRRRFAQREGCSASLLRFRACLKTLNRLLPERIARGELNAEAGVELGVREDELRGRAAGVG